MVEGSCCPIFLKGGWDTKTKTWLRQKIPKTSKNIYNGLYLRSFENFIYMYSLDGLFVASIHKSRDAKDWIDRNIELIGDRVGKLTTVQAPTLFSV